MDLFELTSSGVVVRDLDIEPAGPDGTGFNTGLLIITGSGFLTASGSVVNNDILQIGEGGGFGTSGNLAVGGNLDNNATFDHLQGIVRFDGGASQTARGSLGSNNPLDQVEISGQNTDVTFATSVQIDNTLIIDATNVGASDPVLTLQDDLDLNGPLTVNDGAKIDLDDGTNGSGTLNVASSVSLDGIFTPGSETIVFDGSSNQSLTGTPDGGTSFAGFEVSNGNTVTLDIDDSNVTPLTIGTLGGSDGNLTIGNPNNVSVDAEGAVPGNLTVNSGNTLTLTGGLDVAGDFTVDGAYDATTNSATTTFDGSAAQEVKGTPSSLSFQGFNIGNDVTLDFDNSSTGTITIPSLGGNGGNLIIGGGNFDVSVDAKGTVPGDLTISSGNTLALTGRLTIGVGDTGGTLTNNGTLTGNGNTLRLDGDNNQSVSGSSFRIGRIEVRDNNNSRSVTLGADLTVEGDVVVDDPTTATSTLTFDGGRRRHCGREMMA